METLPAFIATTFVLTGSPGPNTLSVAAVGASFGRTRGLEYMLGLNIGMVAVIGIVATGLASLMLSLPGLSPFIALAAALYFLFLAYRIATAPPLAQTSSNMTTQAPRWYEGAGLSIVNPKAYAAMAALFSGYVLIENNLFADAAWKAGLILAIIALVNFSWLFVGAAMTKYLRNERTSRTINRTFAVLLLLSVALATLA